MEKESIIVKILNNYFNNELLLEYNKLLTHSTHREKSLESSLSKTENEQLAINTSFQPNYAADIDLLISFAKEKLTPSKLIEFLSSVGEVSISHGEFNSAIIVYKYLLGIAGKNIKLQNIAAHTYLALGDIFSRQANWKEALANIKKAKKLFDEQRDYKGSAKCENILGTIEGDKGNLRKAKKHFEASLSFLNPKKDNVLIGMLEVNLGILNNIQGNYDLAYTYYQRALIKYEQMHDSRRIAEVRHNLGMLLTIKEEYENALSEFDLSISVSLKLGYLPILALSYLSKAYIYTRFEDFQFAEAFAGKSLETAKKLNDRLTIADVYKIKGIIEKSRKNFSLAENYLQTSLRINTELGNLLNRAETEHELGLLFIELNKKQKADVYFKNAIAAYKEMKAFDQVKKIESYLKIQI